MARVYKMRNYGVLKCFRGPRDMHHILYNTFKCRIAHISRDHIIVQLSISVFETLNVLVTHLSLQMMLGQISFLSHLTIYSASDVNHSQNAFLAKLPCLTLRQTIISEGLYIKIQYETHGLITNHWIQVFLDGCYSCSYHSIVMWQKMSFC